MLQHMMGWLDGWMKKSWLLLGVLMRVHLQPKALWKLSFLLHHHHKKLTLHALQILLTSSAMRVRDNPLKGAQCY